MLPPGPRFRVRSAFYAYFSPPERTLLDYFVVILDSSDFFTLCIGDLPRHLRLHLQPLYLALLPEVRACDRILL